ncbi:hypothetical protein VPNG_04250 [Cytospora leucostoma]|uniref:Uncharacterized protein n=1 Tax=Cytospora leucostoma TaxID=1230097 RepID=A0A423XE15_9PEZI|nr:hypothetical protein VPNG_04250 [Cytospora leucostoma]
MASPTWSPLGYLDVDAPPGRHWSQFPLEHTTTTATSPQDSSNNGYPDRNGSLLDSSRASDIDAKSLTPSQVDRICNLVDTGLGIPAFCPSFRKAPAPLRMSSSSLRVDLSRLAVVTLFLRPDGLPKGLIFTNEQGRAQSLGDCEGDPGCVRIWGSADLKYLVYSNSISGRLGTRPYNPEIFRVQKISFAANVNDNETAIAMTGMVKFQFSSLGLVVDLRPIYNPYEQTHEYASGVWGDDAFYHNRAVVPNIPEATGAPIGQKDKTGKFRRVVTGLVQGGGGQQTMVKRVGAAIRRVVKRMSDQSKKAS